MKLLVFKSFWGMSGTAREKVGRIRGAGFDGFEAPFQDAQEAQTLAELAEENGLRYILQMKADDFEIFAAKLAMVRGLSPVCVVSHTGRDTMSEAQQDALFSRAMELERSLPFPVAHETHRSRPTYSPWSTNRLLRRFPQLRLTADFSHWCCVCESLLEDQEKAMRKPIERTIHLHARVGYAQGPQVSCPAASENAAALEAHERWWRGIAQSHRGRGAAQMTATIEYGPPPYLHTLPHTDQPVADLWDTCLWGARRLKALLDDSEAPASDERDHTEKK